MHPLNVVSRGGGGGIWLELETHDVDGLGWCNTATNGVYMIENPLYQGLNELPIYAGLDRFVDVQDVVDYNDIARPPIFLIIQRCLNDAVRMKSKTDAIQALMNCLAPRWAQFMLNLNRFIITYGETGFRLNDEARMQMEEVIDQRGLGESLNYPARLKIGADSIYKFILRLPEVFTLYYQKYFSCRKLNKRRRTTNY